MNSIVDLWNQHQEFTGNFVWKSDWNDLISLKVTLIGCAIYLTSVVIYKIFLEPKKIEKKTKKTKKADDTTSTKDGELEIVEDVKPKRFKDTKLFKTIEGIHHGFLALWSIYMFIGVTYNYYNLCATKGLDYCLWVPKDAGLFNGHAGWYMWMFVFSKFYEFGDTYLMMTKGYKLILLHYWHHLSVPILTFVNSYEQSSVAWTGPIANTFVHSIMYTYYTFRGLGIFKKQLNIIKPYITSIQIIQFATVLLHGCYGLTKGMSTDFYWTTVTSYTIYFSYLVLFINFFVGSYLNKKAARKVKAE